MNNAQWVTICGDYQWDFQGAIVVCRQLGYSGARISLRYGFYGEGAGPNWLYDVQCQGTEADIFECNHEIIISYHYCGYNGDAAGVQCIGIWLLF